MTEDEAKTKTCCGPLPVLIGLLAVARPQSNDIPHAHCIGPACMAWRWMVHPRHASPPSPASGYCGLAGAPQ